MTSRVFKGTKKQAERALAKLVAEVDEKPYVRPTTATLSILLERYLHHHAAAGKSPNTLRSYRQLAEKIDAALGELTLADLCAHPEAIDRFIGQLSLSGLSSGSVMRHYRVLSGAFTQAERWRWIDASPMRHTTPPKERRARPKPPSSSKVQQILAAADAIDATFGMALRLSAATGARRGEVCGLQWGDISGEVLTIQRGVIEIDRELIIQSTKTHQERRLHLDAGTLAALEVRRARRDVFAQECAVALKASSFIISDDPTGATPWRPDRLTKAFKRALKETGIECRLHDLRHWHASELLDMGESIINVAARLGHLPATTLGTYGHLMHADEKAAAGIGRLLDQ